MIFFTCQMMESENGVNVEDESCAVEMPQVDNSAVDLTNEGENLSSSKTKIQASVTVTKSKNVKASKVLSLGYHEWVKTLWIYPFS